MKKTPIIEISKVIQGEGKFTGIPHILIRMSGCNLNCSFKGSICDAHYASWQPEEGSYTLEQLKDEMKRNKQIHHFLITGGEPTFNLKLLLEIVRIIKTENSRNFITIETNGTRFIHIPEVDFWSISPKLSSSVPKVGDKTPYRLANKKDVEKHLAEYHNPESVQKIINSSRGNFQLKFVISNEKDAKEAMKYLHSVFTPESIERSKSWVYFMPEGDTKEKLSRKRKWLIDYCIELGVNYTDRLHIVAFGNERNR